MVGYENVKLRSIVYAENSLNAEERKQTASIIIHVSLYCAWQHAAVQLARLSYSLY